MSGSTGAGLACKPSRCLHLRWSLACFQDPGPGLSPTDSHLLISGGAWRPAVAFRLSSYVHAISMRHMYIFMVLYMYISHL